MLLGLASILCNCFTGIPAIILGAQALGNASEKGKPKAWVGIGFGSVTTLGVFIYAAVAPPPAPAPSASNSSPPAARSEPSPERAATPPTPKVELPPTQAALCSTVGKYAADYKAARSSGANELKLSKLRRSRAAALKQAVPGRKFSNWVAEVKTLATTSEGHAVLVVELPCDTVIGTWNNTLSDIMDNSLISPSSKLYDAVSEFDRGDPVRVSGRFLADDTNGFREMSITESGSMTDPEFVVQFSGIGGP